MQRRQDNARAQRVIAVHFIGRVASSPPAIRRVLGRLKRGTSSRRLISERVARISSGRARSAYARSASSPSAQVCAGGHVWSRPALTCECHANKRIEQKARRYNRQNAYAPLLIRNTFDGTVQRAVQFHLILRLEG